VGGTCSRCGEQKFVYKFSSGRLRKREYPEDIVLYGRIILKFIFEYFICLNIGTNGGRVFVTMMRNLVFRTMHVNDY
jgi:hypothetical protein